MELIEINPLIMTSIQLSAVQASPAYAVGAPVIDYLLIESGDFLLTEADQQLEVETA